MIVSFSIFAYLEWNIASLKDGTHQTLRNIRPHVFTFQETRRIINDSTLYNLFNKLRTGSQGDGIAVGIDKQFNSVNRSDLIPDYMKNLEILFIHSVHPLLEIFTINFYIPPQDKKVFNATRCNIQGWILSMINNKPNALWIIAGDFNSKQIPFKLLTPTTTPEHTFKRKKGDKVISSVTDWTMSPHDKIFGYI